MPAESREADLVRESFFHFVPKAEAGLTTYIARTPLPA